MPQFKQARWPPPRADEASPTSVSADRQRIRFMRCYSSSQKMPSATPASQPGRRGTLRRCSLHRDDHPDNPDKPGKKVLLNKSSHTASGMAGKVARHACRRCKWSGRYGLPCRRTGAVKNRRRSLGRVTDLTMLRIMTASQTRDSLYRLSLCALFFLSGASALIYELVWQRLLN